jgi:hypothetical protein
MTKLMPPTRWQGREKPVNPERPALQLFLSQLLGLSLDDIRAVNSWPAGIGSLSIPPGDLEESAERVGAVFELLKSNATIHPRSASCPTHPVFMPQSSTDASETVQEPG